MLITDVGSSDVDARLTTVSSSGEALYFRVTDGSNWLRARVVKTPYYFTDSQYSYQYTQWLIENWHTVHQYQDRWFQRQYSATSYGSWSSWSTYDQSACSLSAGNVGIPSDTDTAQFRVVNPVTSNCASGKHKYDKQTRTRDVVTIPVWENEGTSPPAGFTATGATRYVNNGDPYSGSPHAAAGTYSTPVPVTYDTYDGESWQDSPTVIPPSYVDPLIGPMARDSGPQWWTYGDNSTNGNDPCAYMRNHSGKQVTSCALTGVNRTGAQLGSTYSVVLEKSLAGNVTNLATWSLGGSAATGLRVTAHGSKISAYAGSGAGSILGSIRESSFATQTRDGCGLGGADTSAPTATLTDCSLQGSDVAPSVPAVLPTIAVTLDAGTTLDDVVPTIASSTGPVELVLQTNVGSDWFTLGATVSPTTDVQAVMENLYQQSLNDPDVVAGAGSALPEFGTDLSTSNVKVIGLTTTSADQSRFASLADSGPFDLTTLPADNLPSGTDDSGGDYDPDDSHHGLSADPDYSGAPMNSDGTLQSAPSSALPCDPQGWFSPRSNGIKAYQYYDSLSDQTRGFIKLSFTWDIGSLMNLFCGREGNVTYEHDFKTYNYDGQHIFAPGSVWAWSSTMPRAYKDTTAMDDPNELYYTVGTSDALQLRAGTKYVIKMWTMGGNASVDTADLYGQRGIRAPQGCYSTWCVNSRAQNKIIKNWSISLPKNAPTSGVGT